jgi:sialic acid synthase SpsE
MLGNESKKIQRGESKNLHLIRRSIYAADNFHKNTIIKKNMIKILRPVSFYQPNDIKKILNKRIKKRIESHKAFFPKYFK